MNARSMLNSESYIQAFRRRRGIKSALLRWLCYIAIAITVGSLLTIVAYICINGIPHISWNLLFGEYSADNPSMGFAIVSTLELAALSILIAGPLGVGCAIYLCEYARRKSPLVSAIRLATETLSGIPSIIYGLFGALFFGTALGLGYSVICGVLTISIMVLPTIIRTSEEAILSVNDMYREGSLALGAGKLRTIMHVVLPSAMKGIISSFSTGHGAHSGRDGGAAVHNGFGGADAREPAQLVAHAGGAHVHKHARRRHDRARDGVCVGRGAADTGGGHKPVCELDGEKGRQDK